MLKIKFCNYRRFSLLNIKYTLFPKFYFYILNLVNNLLDIKPIVMIALQDFPYFQPSSNTITEFVFNVLPTILHKLYC